MAKAKASAGKAAAKAAKKEKSERLATRKLTKQVEKEKKKTAPPSKKQEGGGGGGKKTKQGGGKGGGTIDEMDEEDLDALLASYREKWETEHVVNEEKVGGPPSRRANASWTSCPLGNDLYLFGGEYFDGEKVTFYQDLFRYIPERNEWKTYSSSNQPGPRSAHQMVATPSQGGMIWLFGGEFSGSKQNAFHHYRDLWAFSIESKTWERIDTKLRPSARSGHRMTFWKHYLVLFGGFIDTGVKTQYLNDLWIFDTQGTFKWIEIKQNDLRRPSPRSGFSFLPTAEGIVLHGGYCKKYVKGQRTQGVALEDTWFLKMDTDLPKLEWVKRRKIGYAPSTRSGCTMTLWQAKSMAVLFGGVTDTEADEESMESTFHKDLFGYQLLGTGRWISLNLKRPKKKGGGGRRKKKQQQQRRQQEQDEEDDDDGEKEQQPAEEVDNQEEEEEEEEEEEDPNDPLKSIPLERYNAMMAVQRNILYVYGGIYEAGNREYTLDDFYTLDLSKLERFICLKECPIDALEWNESDDEDDDQESEEEEDGEEESESESEGEGDEIPEGYEFDQGADQDDQQQKRNKMSQAQKDDLRQKAKAFIGVSQDTQHTENDILSTPIPSENLRNFYERTKSFWASTAMVASNATLRGKEIRKQGFALAEQKYAEYKPILEEIERIREEAGLDEKEKNFAKAGGIGAGTVGAESRNRR